MRLRGYCGKREGASLKLQAEYGSDCFAVHTLETGRFLPAWESLETVRSVKRHKKAPPVPAHRAGINNVFRPDFLPELFREAFE